MSQKSSVGNKTPNKERNKSLEGEHQTHGQYTQYTIYIFNSYWFILETNHYILENKFTFHLRFMRWCMLFTNVFHKDITLGYIY